MQLGFFYVINFRKKLYLTESKQIIMKNILFLLSLLFVSSLVKSQDTEGHITYDMDVSVDDSQKESMASVVKMMDGSIMEIYFKDSMTRSEIKMGAMMTITCIADTESDKLIMLIGGMMGKKAFISTSDELNKSKTEEPEFTVELFDETKTITGFECKKAILKDKDGNEITYWYTDEIAAKTEGNQYIKNGIPGFPLEIILKQNGMDMVFTAKRYENEVSNPEKLFDLTIPSGYDEISVKQYLKMGL